LLLKNMWISMVVFMMMSLLILFIAKVPFSFYVKLLLLPLSFLCLGWVSLVISISAESLPGGDGVLLLKVAQIHLYYLSGQVPLVLPLLVGSFSSVACLYFLILTTPISEILTIFHRAKVPTLMLELVMLTYRYLFLLLDTAQEIYVSQSSRLGYDSIKSGLRSGGSLLTTLFVKTYKQAKELQISIDSRGGGTLYDPIYERKPYSMIHLCFIILFFLSIFLLYLTI